MDITDTVGSPTFKLVSEYEGDKTTLYHIDCYRFNSIQEFINIGGEEYLASERGITLIEWADIIESILPTKTIIINFDRTPGNENYREIIVSQNL